MKRGFAVLLILASATLGWAQPGPAWIPSLEYLASNSERIAIGALSAEGFTLQEPLKGKLAAQEQFENSRRAKAGPRVMVFIERTNTITHTIPLDHKGPLAIRMSFELVRDEASLRMILNDAMRYPKSRGYFVANVPDSESELPPYSSTGMGVSVSLPIDRRLEALARIWLDSPEGTRRALGVRALAYFRSQRNIQLIQKRLDDPYEQSWDWGQGSFAVRTVRESARDVLDGWDVRWEPVRAASIALSREMAFVPAGPFQRGGTPGAQAAGPLETATLDSFWISRTPVTVAQFRAFCRATSYDYDWKAHRPRLGYKDDHPMVNVVWEDARAFCLWVGGDLPTEDQWEKAARGPGGFRFPWGNEWAPSRCHGNWQRFFRWRTTAPVGVYLSGASPYHCLDMISNVSQWCLGPDPKARPVRGSSWDTSDWDQRFAQVAGRGSMHGQGRIESVGFRVAATHELRLP